MRELARPDRSRRVCLGGATGSSERPRVLLEPLVGHSALHPGFAWYVTVFEIVEPTVPEKDIFCDHDQKRRQ